MNSSMESSGFPVNIKPVPFSHRPDEGNAWEEGEAGSRGGGKRQPPLEVPEVLRAPAPPEHPIEPPGIGNTQVCVTL